MSEENIIERCTSYGRGGAGNLRRPSAVKQAHEKLAAMAEEATPSRRRSSTWSMSSNGEHKGWKNLFRRASTAEEGGKIDE